MTVYARNSVSPAYKRLGGSITAQNKFTTDVNGTLAGSTSTVGANIYGTFAVIISGTWSATVSIQRSDDAGVTWNDLSTGISNTPTVLAITSNGTLMLTEHAKGVLYRVGVKTGNFTSGTIVVSIQQ